MDFPLPFSFFNLCELIFRVSSTFAFFFVGIIFFFVLPFWTVDALRFFFSLLPEDVLCKSFPISNLIGIWVKGMVGGGVRVDWIIYTHIGVYQEWKFLESFDSHPFHTFSHLWIIFRFSPMFRSYSAEYYFWVWMWTVAHWPFRYYYFFLFPRKEIVTSSPPLLMCGDYTKLLSSKSCDCLILAQLKGDAQTH